MKKFKFTLQGLLKMKMAQEREIQNELAEVQRLCLQQGQQIELTRKKHQEWTQYYTLSMQKKVHAVQLGVIDRHIQNLKNYREQLEISLDVLLRKKESVLQQFYNIRKELKSLEHIRGKQWHNYQYQLAHLEYQQADEMAMMRFVREKGII